MKCENLQIKGGVLMKKMSSYLLVMFMILFWFFRIVAAGASTLGIDMGIPIIDFNFEIALIFITFACILFVIRRNLIGAVMYAATYIYYFGVDLFQMLVNNASIDYIRAIISLIGVVLPLAVLFELLFDKNSKKHPKDNKTDWYYNNEAYDRKYDERADKNNYRTL